MISRVINILFSSTFLVSSRKMHWHFVLVFVAVVFVFDSLHFFIRCLFFLYVNCFYKNDYNSWTTLTDNRKMRTLFQVIKSMQMWLVYIWFSDYISAFCVHNFYFDGDYLKIKVNLIFFPNFFTAVQRFVVHNYRWLFIYVIFSPFFDSLN